MSLGAAPPDASTRRWTRSSASARAREQWRVEGDAALVERDRGLERQAARLEPRDDGLVLGQGDIEGHGRELRLGQRRRHDVGLGHRVGVSHALDPDVQRAGRQADVERIADGRGGRVAEDARRPGRGRWRSRARGSRRD